MAEKPVMPSLLAAVQPAIEFYLRQHERTDRFKPKTLAELVRTDKSPTSPPADSLLRQPEKRNFKPLTLKELNSRYEPRTSARTDTQPCEEGTLVDNDGNMIDTSLPPSVAPAPPTTPASPAILHGANVALADAPSPALSWIKKPIEPKGRSSD